MITKKACDTELFKRNFYLTDSAREAWKWIIIDYKHKVPNCKLILPGYIGWSANEGSGIFDAVLKSQVDYDFYSLSADLRIDINDLKDKVESNKNPLVLLIHYFGFIDPNYVSIINWLKLNNVYFIEDCAHSWLSDLIGGKCGRAGRYTFYSLHKLLPLNSGGMLVDNFPSTDSIITKHINKKPAFCLNYDYKAIYDVRRRNFLCANELLKDFQGISIIQKKLPEGICPQTFPVILEKINRDHCYTSMNKKGFGIVSLYHTMIMELRNQNFDCVNYTSKKIINFPIHQDIDLQQIDCMIQAFKTVCNG